jgi:hypothetical protein
LIGALIKVGFEAYTGELDHAFSEAFEGKGEGNGLNRRSVSKGKPRRGKLDEGA